MRQRRLTEVAAEPVAIDLIRRYEHYASVTDKASLKESLPVSHPVDMMRVHLRYSPTYCYLDVESHLLHHFPWSWYFHLRESGT